MNVEEGLLNKLMDKLREELQGMIRYELYRGLDRPEANTWTLSVPGVDCFTTFLQSMLTNSLYPKETLSVSDYLSRTTNMIQKFKFFKETGGFLLPSDTFWTVSFMNDLLLGNKTLLHTCHLAHFSLSLAESKDISQLLLALPSVQAYLPSNFSKSHHDSEYVLKICFVLDASTLESTLTQYKLFSSISNFSLPKLCYQFSFVPPSAIDIQILWDSASHLLEALEKIREHEAKLANCTKQDMENRRIVQELVHKSTGDEAFERLLESSC